jgi:hypothetical protein
MEKDIDKKELIHGQTYLFPHFKVLGNKNFPKESDTTNETCNGVVIWDEVLEGYICSICELYTGVK